MKKKKEKKKPSLFSIFIIAAILFSAMGDSMDEDVLLAIIGLVFIIGIFAVIFKLVKKTITNNIKTDFPQHSHDRLSNNTLKIEAYDSFEHYKRQIDGFLAAGIIDRAEYKVLYEKYKKTLK